MSQTVLNFLVKVLKAAAALVITDPAGNVLADGSTTSLPDETVGVAVDQPMFTVSGGVAPYKVSQTGVPDGQTVTTADNPDGSMGVFLEGTPTTESDPANPDDIVITVSDAAGNTVMARSKRPA